MNVWLRTAAAMGVAVAVAVPAQAGSWPKRGGNLQATGDAGTDPVLTPEDVADLEVDGVIQTASVVNATPVVTDGLLVTGDWGGTVYVVDLATRRRLIQMKTPSGGEPPEPGLLPHAEDLGGSYIGVQATPVVADVTVPDPASPGGTREERRVYVGANHAEATLYCFNLTKLLADRDATPPPFPTSDGTAYLCEGATWPISLAVPGEDPNGVLNGSPIFSRDQPIRDPDSGEVVVRDVIYAPSTGLDCADGHLYALDAYSAKIYWSWDPVLNGDGTGGVIWTMPAMDAAREHVYVTTGDCVTKPQMGEKAESLVALDAVTGVDAEGQPKWWHQRRLLDAADFDIGNFPVVADVEGEDGCHVVISTDKDGCIYAFDQDRDVPEVGEPGYDPLRPGQQRVLWRQCFTPGSLNGGFNASGAAVHGRHAVAQVTAYPLGHAGLDDANAFAVDVCTGAFRWASSSVGAGRSEGAIASGMYFSFTYEGGFREDVIGPVPPPKRGNELVVVRVDSANDLVSRTPELLATVALPARPSAGGGGPAIVDGVVYVPTEQGIAVVRIKTPGSRASAPVPHGTNTFAGPYPLPVIPGAGSPAPAQPVVLPDVVLADDPRALSVDPKDPYPVYPDGE